MSPTFSVIIPYHNSHRTIRQTVESIQHQDGAAYEIIIVDDRSGGASRQVIDDLAQNASAIKVRSAKGAGPSAARNTGAEIATGSFLWFLDADDVLLPNAFLNVLNAFDGETKPGVVLGRVRITATPGADAGVTTPFIREISLANVLGENCACTASNIVVRRQAFWEIGAFNETFMHAEDQEWLVRAYLNKTWRLQCIPFVTLEYRTTIGGLSSNLPKMEAGWRRIASVHELQIAACGEVERRKAKALFFRYLSRRSLRLGQSRTEAMRYFLTSFAASPSLISQEFRRTAATGAASLAVACFGVQFFRRFTQ